MAKRRLIFLFALLGSLTLVSFAQAAIEIYDFRSADEEARFHALGGVLRCPKCQNQSVIDSDSTSAYDMRQELFQLLQEDYTDAEIFAHLTARFGEYIHYKPPVRSETWLLWYLPPVLVVSGLLLLVLLARRRHQGQGKSKPAQDEQEQDEKEREQRLQALLVKDHHKEQDANANQAKGDL